MSQRVLCLNAAGAGDRLTLHGIYRVVSERDYKFVTVIDDTGNSTEFSALRFTPTGTKEELKVTYGP